MNKILSKADLPRLGEQWMAQATVYAPVRRNGLTEFQPLHSMAQAELQPAANTRRPPKSLFLPQSEAMFRVLYTDFEPIEAEVGTRVILGIRACDARAVQLLDAVFETGDHPDPYWARRREQTALVVLGCANPSETCFCTAVGSGPFDGRGADAMLIDVGDDYVVDVLSETGQALFGLLPDASGEQMAVARQVQDAATSKVKRPFETDGIRDKLYSLFDSDYWSDIQHACLGCGVCTFLCPTCHCFDIVDEIQRSERVRNWDSCMFRVYTQEASGHNPHPTNVERIRQRIMHKFAYFPDLYHENGCTGCGRCVRYCPANLDIRHIIAGVEVQAGKQEQEYAQSV